MRTALHALAKLDISTIQLTSRVGRVSTSSPSDLERGSFTTLGSFESAARNLFRIRALGLVMGP
jgi:hypothetical protein